ncbi:MAG: MFS transporter [bacterium]|nr:MFS transporter [bacterium]
MIEKRLIDFPHFFAHRLRREVKELYLSVAILNFAVAAVQIFEPMYLYTLGYSVAQIILFYLGVYGVYICIMPLGAKFASRFGFERSMLVSTPFYVLYYVALFALPQMPWLFFAAPLMFALQKTFYWPGYHSDFAKHSDEREQAREISTLAVISNAVFILGPLIGGFIISLTSFETLFIVVIVLIIVSNLPLLTSRESVDPQPFSYTKAYRRLFRKHHRRKFVAYFGYGEELIVMTIWPVFIYLIISNFATIGAVVALAVLATSLVTLFVGRLSDKHRKHPIIRFGTVMYSLTWWLRYFASSTGHVLLIDTLSRVAKDMIDIPLIAITYFRARKYNIMKGVLFLEMALVIGKLFALVATLAVFTMFGMTTGFLFAFILAGTMSLLYNYL